MNTKLLASASNWKGDEAVPCYFTATADGAPLYADDDAYRTGKSRKPVYTIQDGTKEVQVTAKPDPTPSKYWETITPVSFSVSSDGVITLKPDGRGLLPPVKLTPTYTPAGAFTVMKVFHANIQLSRFKDVTPTVLGLLNHPPIIRTVWNNRKKKWEIIEVDEVTDHTDLYGTPWPPKDWDLHDVPDAHFLADVKNPVEYPGSTSGVLKVAKGLAIENKVDSLVLRLANVEAPQLFAVTWPKAIAPENGSLPTPFLLFVRQTNSQYTGIGKFAWSYLADCRSVNAAIAGLPCPDPELLKPYPDNFDYADTGLFEALHYATAPPWRMPGAKADPLFWPYSKGVPYQVRKAGVNVVTVCPCPRYYGDEFSREYGVLSKTEETGKILEELQAFMFWRAGIQDPPKSVGKTAIAAYSSGNRILRRWLNDLDNTEGDFLSKTVQALYFLDPPPDVDSGINLISDCIKFSLAWAAGDPNNEKRIRLYQRIPWPSHMKLLGPSLNLSESEPPEPFVRNSADGKRTLSVVSSASWKRTVANALGSTPPYDWDTFNEPHHLIAATMLTHALAQDKDLF